MIQFKAAFERMVRDRENEVKVTFTVSASELGNIILIPAEVLLNMTIEESEESVE